MIEIRALIAEFRLIREDIEAVGKILRNKELLFVFCGEQYAVPLSVGRGTRPQIDSDIEHLSLHDADKLILREIDLKMKTSQDPFRRAGLIVLYKDLIDPGRLKVVIIVCLHKIAAVIAVNGRCDDLETFDVTCFYCNFSHDFFLFHKRLYLNRPFSFVIFFRQLPP